MIGGFFVLPAAPGTCEHCAVDHPPEIPHNAGSLGYQYIFYEKHGRWPTWADAVAHCDELTQRLWREELQRRGRWPADHPEPIAEIRGKGGSER